MTKRPRRPRGRAQRAYVRFTGWRNGGSSKRPVRCRLLHLELLGSTASLHWYARTLPGCVRSHLDRLPQWRQIQNRQAHADVANQRLSTEFNREIQVGTAVTHGARKPAKGQVGPFSSLVGQNEATDLPPPTMTASLSMISTLRLILACVFRNHRGDQLSLCLEVLPEILPGVKTSRDDNHGYRPDMSSG